MNDSAGIARQAKLRPGPLNSVGDRPVPLAWAAGGQSSHHHFIGGHRPPSGRPTTRAPVGNPAWQNESRRRSLALPALSGRPSYAGARRFRVVAPTKRIFPRVGLFCGFFTVFCTTGYILIHLRECMSRRSDASTSLFWGAPRPLVHSSEATSPLSPGCVYDRHRATKRAAWCCLGERL